MNSNTARLEAAAASFLSRVGLIANENEISEDTLALLLDRLSDNVEAPRTATPATPGNFDAYRKQVEKMPAFVMLRGEGAKGTVVGLVNQACQLMRQVLQESSVTIVCDDGRSIQLQVLSGQTISEIEDFLK